MMLYRFNRERDIAYVSLLYTFIVFFFSFGMDAIADMEFYKSGVIGEFVLLLLPALIFVEFGIIKGKKEFLRLNRIKLSSVINIILLIIFSLPLLGMINNLVYYAFSELFGAVEIYSTPVPADTKELILSLLVLAMVPAVCEEFLFRGVIQGVLRRHGHVFAIFSSALLFSFLHFDIQRVIGVTLLGALIGYVVYRTNSLYAGILAHFVNNTAAILVSYYFVDSAGFQRITKESYSIFMGDDITSMISTLMYVVIFSVFFILILIRFIRSTKETKQVRIGTNFDRSAKGYLFLLPAMIFLVYWFIIQSQMIIKGSENLLSFIFSSFY